MYSIKRSEKYELYLDRPEWMQGDSTIKACRPLFNIGLYLEQNKDVSFLVHRTFYATEHDTHQMVEYNTPSDRIKSENPDGPTP